MVAMLYKWLIVFALANFTPAHHPMFLSVTEIEHNAKAQSLEITCKIFTDDFETALRKVYKKDVDLLNAKYKQSMNLLVDDYIKKHLLLKVDGKTAVLNFLGFEQEEEGIISYYEVKNIPSVKKLDVTDNILYEFKEQQIEIVHVMVNGKRKSTQLTNPNAEASFEF